MHLSALLVGHEDTITQIKWNASSTSALLDDDSKNIINDIHTQNNKNKNRMILPMLIIVGQHKHAYEQQIQTYMMDQQELQC